MLQLNYLHVELDESHPKNLSSQELVLKSSPKEAFTDLRFNVWLGFKFFIFQLRKF